MFSGQKTGKWSGVDHHARVLEADKVCESMSAESKRFQILVCDGPSCGVCHGSEALVAHIEARVAGDERLRDRVDLAILTCFGRCDEGPNMLVRELAAGEDGTVEPDFELLLGVRGLYLGMDADKVDRMLDQHCVSGQPLESAQTYD
jgi:(2Fe-2S) ferredoxin